MTIENLIKKYDIKAAENNGNRVLRIYNQIACNKDNAIGEIKSRKEEILAWFDHQTEQKEERHRKIEEIPGLNELKSAIADMEAWKEEFEASFDDVGGMGVRPRPKYDIDAMHAQYPRASAYIKAESWALASNDEKSKAGKKALERIINGEPETEVIEEMERKWSEYALSHMWD